MPTCMYGTSGAGKTRTAYEYLSRHKRFYLLASDFNRNLGSRDLQFIINNDGYEMIRINEDTKNGISFKNSSNREKVQNISEALIFCRYLVHEKLTKARGKELTPYEWLLYQLFPDDLLGTDLFRFALEYALYQSRDQKLELSLDLYAKLNGGTGVERRTWPVFVDEAQALLKIGKHYFVNRNEEERINQSFFSALVQGLGNIAISSVMIDHAVFSGTGLAFEQLSAEISSIVGKRSGEFNVDVVFADFQQLDVDGVKKYMGNFIDLKHSDYSVITHVANWLRGRPRWAATFLELYVSRTEKTNYETKAWKTQGTLEPGDAILIQALDRYLNIMTRPDEKKEDRRESWSAGNSSAYACFTRVYSNLLSKDEGMKSKLINQIKSDLECAVYRFAIGEDKWIFSNVSSSIFLIRQGVIAVKGSGGTNQTLQGYLDEPNVVEAGLNFFDLEKRLQNDLKESLPAAYGQAFERLILSGLMMKKGGMNNFLQQNIDHPDLLNGFDAPRKSAYGVICVVADNDINKTIKWVSQSLKATFEGQVPPYCYPDEQIGPDLICLLRFRSNYSIFDTVIIQSKYASVVINQQDALRTLVPNKFYADKRETKAEKMSGQLTDENIREWNKVKDELVSDDRPCVRILVQMPAEPTSPAKSGMVAGDATSPTGKSRSKKRDWMVVVRSDNAGQIFADESIDLIHLLKQAKSKKVKESS